MIRLPYSRWEAPRFFARLSFRAKSTDPVMSEPGERVVRAIIPPVRSGENEIELKLIAALQSDGSVSSGQLVQRISRDLFDEELRRGAAAVDIGIFGSRLFEPEVAQTLSAGAGTLWEVD